MLELGKNRPNDILVVCVVSIPQYGHVARHLIRIAIVRLAVLSEHILDLCDSSVNFACELIFIETICFCAPITLSQTLLITIEIFFFNFLTEKKLLNRESIARLAES